MKKIIPVLSLLLFQGSILFSQSGIITTVAGNGVQGYSGDGGQATAAELDVPWRVATDTSGNIYIADMYNNRVRKVNATTGIITTVAGNGIQGRTGDGGPATAAELNNVPGLAVDKKGNIYMALALDPRIRMVNTLGIISTVAGTGSGGYTGDGGSATAATLYYPLDVFVDLAGNMYIADTWNNAIRKVNTSGIITTIAGNGIFAFSGDGGPATAAELAYPSGVTTDAYGNVFIADWSNQRIREVNTSGIISTVAGNGVAGFAGEGGPATAVELTDPWKVAFDTAGNLLIIESSNSRVSLVNSSGIINDIAGILYSGGFSGDGGPATAAELDGCIGLATTATGTILIADSYNYRIRKISGEISTGISQPSNTLQLSIYPNPAQNIIYVQVQGGAKAEVVEVYTITGQKMQTSSHPADIAGRISSYAINSSSLSDGIYFLKVQLQDGATLVKKVEIVK